MNNNDVVGVLGATSLVGNCLLQALEQSSVKVIAFSRQTLSQDTELVRWCKASTTELPEDSGPIENWICVAPIWVLPDYFKWLVAMGAKKIIVLSSTSRFTKVYSKDPKDKAVANNIIDSESKLVNWAKNLEIDFGIVRPTLIYGLGLDKNVSEIMRFICRWGFFPILGEGKGLRQPVRVEDVAKACKLLLDGPISRLGRAYNISGSESLAYKDMVLRIFTFLGKRPLLLHLPRWLIRMGLMVIRILPAYHHWTFGMGDRMSQDMVFDHTDFTVNFGLLPKPFHLDSKDLPESCH